MYSDDYEYEEVEESSSNENFFKKAYKESFYDIKKWCFDLFCWLKKSYLSSEVLPKT